MSREIKIKFWNRENQELFVVTEIDFNNKTVRGIIDGCPTVAYFQDGELIQFTGFYDRNKTPIFEGDYIKAGAITRLVYWSEKTASFYCKDRDNYGSLLSEFLKFAIQGGVQIEIIGNKFQHPELLEKE